MDYQKNKNQGSERESDKVDLAFFLMRRNFRFVVGGVLLLGLGLWIYSAVTSPIKPKSTGAWSKTIGNYLPKADIDSEPTKADDSDAKEISEQISIKRQRVTDFLANATIEEKIEESLDLRENWMNKELALAYILCWRRAKIARNLIELEVDDTTRNFAYNDYIESILTLDLLNSRGRLGVPGIRDALFEIGSMFGEYPDTVIKSKANVSHVLAPAHTYFETKDLAEIPKMADQFELHSEAILADTSTAIRLVNLISDMYSRTNYDSSLKASGIRIMEKMSLHQDKKVTQAAQTLREQLYFAKVELPTLIDRIQGNNLEARNDIQEFFEALDKNPSSRIQIYQIAINAIAKFKELGKTEDAQALGNWLAQINSRNTIVENREKIDKAIAALNG